MLCVLLASIEIILRVADYYNPNCNFMYSDVFSNVDAETKRKICLDNDSLKWNTVPNLHLIPNQNLDTININNDGFRGKEIQTPKDTDTFRIFIVGGSTTFGVGSTSDNSSIPGELQQMMNSLDDTKKIEVINAGIPKAYSFTEINLIHNKLLNYQPNLIIVYDGWNDIHRPFNEYDKKINNSSYEQFLQLIITNDFYKTSKIILKNVININNQDSISNFDSNMINQKVDLWKTNWNNLCEKMENKNIDVILTLQPLVGTGNKIMTPEEEIHFTKNDHITMLQSYDQYSKSLLYLDKCSQAIDLQNIFDDYDDTIFYDGGHVSDNGNKIVAKKLYEIILEYI